MKKVKNILFLLLTALLVLTGCSSGNSAPTVKAGNDLVIIKNNDVMSLDSAKATDQMSFEVLGATNEGLYTMAANNVEELAGASEVKISEDGKTYTFTLRDTQWSNGDPVIASDYVYAWRKAIDPQTASEYAFIFETAGIVNAEEVAAGTKPTSELGVKALDEKTLEVNLSKTVPFFTKLLAFGTFLPQNEKFATEKGDQYAQNPENLLANGPFKLVEWVSGNNVKVVKNESYWDAEKVSLDSITWKIAKDVQSAVLAFDTGEADFVRLTGDIIENYQGRPELIQSLGGYLWFLIPNLKVAELQNVNLTKAIANAFDREALASLILKDGAAGAHYFVPQQLAASPSGKDFRESNGYTFFTEGAEKAKEYGKEAFKELGIEKLTIELLYEDTDESKKVAEFIKLQVEQNIEGLTLELKSQPKKSRLKLQQEGEFQLTLHRWGPDYPDPSTYLDLFETGVSYNFGGYSSAKYDELVKKAASGTVSAEERWELLLEAEKELLKDAQGPIPVYQIGNATLWSSKVTGWEYHTTGVSYYYKNVKIVQP